MDTGRRSERAGAWTAIAMSGLLAGQVLHTSALAADFPAEFDPRRMTVEEGVLFTSEAWEHPVGGMALGIGDINGDGLSDFVIGTGVDLYEGSVNHLVYGSAGGYDTVLPVADDGATGRVYLGDNARYDRVGDFNGDGFDDWLYQPVADSYFYQGEVPDDLDAYLVLGQAGAYASPFSIDSVDAIRLIGTYPVESIYTSRVHPVGDVNGDGFADLIVVAPVDYGSESATAWLVPGRGGAMPAMIDPASAPASLTSTLRFPNPMYGRYDDHVVSPWQMPSENILRGGADVNGDGIDDLLISDTWNSGPGQVYVVFGNTAGLPPLIDKDTLDGSNGFWIASRFVDGLNDGEYSFSGIALLDDTDGDGVDDLLIGSHSDNQNTTVVYVVSGHAIWTALLDVSALPAMSVFSVQGSSWHQFANTGDMNGDGLGDWLISLDNDSPTGLAVIYGQSGQVDDLELDSIPGDRGFVIQPTLLVDGYSDYWLPWNRVDVGDTNGDGIDDLLLGNGYGLGPIENWTDYLGSWDIAIPRTGLVALVFGRRDQGGPAAPASLYPAYARQLIELRWTLSDTSDVARVEVTRNGEHIASLDPAVHRYEDTTAARDTGYTYALVSVDTAGQRSSSVFLTARNDHAHYPVLAGEVYSDTLAELFWVDDGNDPFFGNRTYDIYRDGELAGTRNALSWLDQQYTPAGHHYIIETNPERFRDDYRLRSDELYLPPDAGTRAPASVGNPKVTLLTPETVRVSWDVAAWGVEPLRYEVLGRDGALMAATTDTAVTVGVTYHDYGLNVGGKIVTIDGNGRRSSPMPFFVYLKEPLRVLLPQEPALVRATGVTDTEATLSWQLEDVGTPPTGFEILRDYEVIAQTTSQTFTDTGLEPDTRYVYEIRSLDAAGRRSLGKSQYLRVVTTGGPFMPSDLKALAYGPTLVEVMWQRAPEGFTTVTGYAVYRNGELIDTVDALSLMDEGLTPGTTYTYEVRSVARGGIVSGGVLTALVTTPVM